MRQSHTIALELGSRWEGSFSTEPVETHWASEAILFIRLLEGELPAGTTARVEISPDGIHWSDEGTKLPLPESSGPTTHVKIRDFGGWLRIAGRLPGGVSVPVIAHLNLKE